MDAKKQLLSLNGDQPGLLNESMLHVIEVRETNMKKRAEQLIDNKLMSFFEQAPTAADD